MPEHIGLSDQQKILVALAAAMGAGCRTCAEKLSAMAAEARIESHEVEAAFAEGLLARQAATETIRAKATSLLGREPRLEAGDGAPQVADLCRLAAAAAANSAPDALRYAGAARSVGATETAIGVAIGIARSIRSKAQGFSDEELGAWKGQAAPCPTGPSETAAAAAGGGAATPGAGCACK